jgi:hypothetical protein
VSETLLYLVSRAFAASAFAAEAVSTGKGLG